MENNDSIKSSHDKYVEAETVSRDSEISSLSNFTDEASEKISTNEILFIEPFYGGSHKQLIDILDFHLNINLPMKKTCLFSLPATKWHWRARTSALYFYKIIPKSSSYKLLFCSSVLNLAELVALRPDLSCLHKIIYFHENQLVYPVRKKQDRDFQFGYNQILSCLVADTVVFNSYYNMNSFLENIDSFLKLQPDFVVKNLKSEIFPKSKVLYFPIGATEFCGNKSDVLHIIWPHRWEHDKNPELFFRTLFELKKNNFPFVVSVVGQSFTSVPDIFEKAKNFLKDEIKQFGRVVSEDEYFKLLRTGHVVVSTANHEFFGVAMLEAVFSGCFPIACNRLVYPEIYPPECLYNTPNQLYKKLKNLCLKPYLAEIYLKKCKNDFEKFKLNAAIKGFNELFLQNSLFSFPFYTQVGPFLEGINKVKELILELEESFRETNNINNNLILRCVLLKAENQTLVHKIDRKRSCTTKHCGKGWELSLPRQNICKLPIKNSSGDEAKQLTCVNPSKSSFRESLKFATEEEIDILHNTIGDLQKKLREKDTKIEDLFQKYMCLKANKNKMETDFNIKISRLEEQLDVAWDTLDEFQNGIKAEIEDTLSSSTNIHEAMFLQEKLRCSKLMYEKVRLNHEIQRLEDVIRRRSTSSGEEKTEQRGRFKSSVDKTSSEPLMRHF